MKIGLLYHSPHKFRHGHAVLAIKLAKDVAALKAVGQNLMHSNLSITDGVYGILSNNDVKQQIKELAPPFTGLDKNQTVEELINQAKNIIALMEKTNRS